MRPIVPVAVFVGTLAAASAAFADDRVSGTLTRTFVIVEDTELVGDVTCEVANATPCFSFGAPNLELRLNGFKISGRADAVTGCAGAATAGEVGVTTSNMSGVVVRGPGLIQRFRGDGITVAGSRNTRIEELTLAMNCMSGVRVLATSFDTIVQGNIAVGNGSSMPGLLCGGI